MKDRQFGIQELPLLFSAAVTKPHLFVKPKYLQRKTQGA